jgi:hypothetical protein
MSLAALLVNTCTITPRTPGDDTATGGVLWTDGTPVTGVACNVQQISGFEAALAGRETGRREFNVYFPIGTTIAVTSKLSAFTGASVGGLSGITLEVTSPPIDHSGRGAYLMVTARENVGDGV